MTTTEPATPVPVTYTLDQVAVITLKVTTDRGEDAARALADALAGISVQSTADELDCRTEIPDGTTIDVTLAAPRGRASLVYAQDGLGREVPVSDDGGLPEPFDGSLRRELADRLANWEAAGDGASADAEHRADADLAAAVAELLGQR